MNDEMLIERIREVNPVPNDSDSGISAAVLLASIDERSGLMQTQKPQRQQQQERTKVGRGLLIAAAVFVVIVLAGVAILLAQPDSEVTNNPTTTTNAPTTTVDAQALDDPRLDAAASGAIDVAGEEGFEATVVPWVPQLVFETGGPDCQPDSDPVQFTDLDTLTAQQTMLSLENATGTGTVEVLKFADSSVAAEASPVFEGLLRSQRECITDAITGAFGGAFRNFGNETLEVDGALGAFLATYELDDGSDGMVYVQVAGGIRDDLMYIVTFSSDVAPVNDNVLGDMFLVMTDASQ